MIIVKKLNEDAIVPCSSSEEAAGLDLFTLDNVDIQPKQRALLHTGIAMQIPKGYAGFIWPRSKLAVRMGVDVLAGLVDSDYRGEIMISLLNTSGSVLEFRSGDRCAQMVIQKHYSFMPIILDDNLGESERGSDGINSLEMRLR